MRSLEKVGRFPRRLRLQFFRGAQCLNIFYIYQINKFPPVHLLNQRAHVRRQAYAPPAPARRSFGRLPRIPGGLLNGIMVSNRERSKACGFAIVPLGLMFISFAQDGRRGLHAGPRRRAGRRLRRRRGRGNERKARQYFRIGEKGTRFKV